MKNLIITTYLIREINSTAALVAFLFRDAIDKAAFIANKKGETKGSTIKISTNETAYRVHTTDIFRRFDGITFKGRQTFFDALKKLSDNDIIKSQNRRYKDGTAFKTESYYYYGANGAAIDYEQKADKIARLHLIQTTEHELSTLCGAISISAAFAFLACRTACDSYPDGDGYANPYLCNTLGIGAKQEMNILKELERIGFLFVASTKPTKVAMVASPFWPIRQLNRFPTLEEALDGAGTIKPNVVWNEDDNPF